ncbi:hypothetical protein L6164_000008 [Bauhinia variegata]|uniref:Uncharacterized protein n=1 Tax=Bauhinia variegata TaxID=167791 RepID=A0ACB9Q7D5_BAUVA|nr:hypothetical protein L6164_000008 [Bauhinia variegata]
MEAITPTIENLSSTVSLKTINTILVEKTPPIDNQEKDEYLLTPKREEARIPTSLMYPPTPQKQKPSLKCNYNEISVRKFFAPPDL